MGLRAIKVDPLASMGFKISEYQSGIRDARREFTGGFDYYEADLLKKMMLYKNFMHQTKLDLMCRKKCTKI